LLQPHSFQHLIAGCSDSASGSLQSQSFKPCLKVFQLPVFFFPLTSKLQFTV
jgi:hypothetical protein